VAASSRVGLELGDQHVQAGHFCLHLCAQCCVHLLQEACVFGCLVVVSRHNTLDRVIVEVDELKRLQAFRLSGLELDLAGGRNQGEPVQSRRVVGDVLVDTPEPYVVGSHLSGHLLDDGGQLSI